MKTELGTDLYYEVDLITDPDTNDRGTEANFVPIVCITTNGFTSGKAKQVTSSKCDGNNETSLPGIGTHGFNVDGLIVSLETAEVSSRANYEKLIQAHLDGQIFFGRTTNATQTYYRESKQWIESYEESAPNAEAATFTASITGVGQVFIAPPVTP